MLHLWPMFWKMLSIFSEHATKRFLSDEFSVLRFQVDAFQTLVSLSNKFRFFTSKMAPSTHSVNFTRHQST
jgi:hypothetical protein